MELKDKIKTELPDQKIKLRSLNPHIVCLLCAGYLVEPTTIIECIHTFCKSCIVRYLQSSKLCPTCGIVVHETEPLSNIKRDHTMEDIMDKILPDLKAKEKKSKEEFMDGIMKKEAETKANIVPVFKPQVDLSNFPSNYRCNEQFNVCLELDRNSEMWLDEMEVVEIHNRYIRCPGRAKILHIKKLIRKFYEPYCTRYELEVKCNDHELDDNDHVRLIYIIYWKRKPQPIALCYGFRKPSVEIQIQMALDHCISNIESDESPTANEVRNSGVMTFDASSSMHGKCSDLVEDDNSCIIELYEETSSVNMNHNGAAMINEEVNTVVDNKCQGISCEVMDSILPETVQ